MASTGLLLSALTAYNGAVLDVRKLIFETIVDPERLRNVATIMPNQHNGDKLGLVGEFGLVGKKATGCSPEYGTDTIGVTEKTWDIQPWAINEQLCYADLEGTLVQYLLNEKTDISKLDEGEVYRQYIAGVIYPRLRTAIEKMLVRFAWFGDKNAATVTDGGVLKNGVNPAYFNLINGFWVQLAAIYTADATKRVTVAANAEASYAAQRTAILAAGVATGIMDRLIMSASPALRGASNKVIYTTLALKDALDYDIRNNNKGSELQWQSIFAGIQETTYNGITLRAVPLFDEIIQTYEGNGTAWNNPYRAVFTTEDNLLVGIGAGDEIADVQIHYDPVSELNYIKAKDKVGALVRQDNLVVVAI